MINDENSCYVGIKDCGCAVAAMVINSEHKKENAKEIAKWIREGLTIERKSVQWVNENFKRCIHVKVNKSG